ncbi:MAG: hypothetical protein K2K24_00820, partial [Clostridia bacterium]|nr:hypothetical protein [Clostridia bacterium]
FYTFTLVFDPEKSTVEYVKQMRVQLEVNAGMGVSDLEFERLEIKVEMWKNGMFKRLYITESYKMKMAGIINSSITLYSDTQYAYEEVAGYTLKEHYDAF